MDGTFSHKMDYTFKTIISGQKVCNILDLAIYTVYVCTLNTTINRPKKRKCEHPIQSRLLLHLILIKWKILQVRDPYEILLLHVIYTKEQHFEHKMQKNVSNLFVDSEILTQN